MQQLSPKSDLPVGPRRGPAKRAKTLTPAQLDHLLQVAASSKDPLRDWVIILLSFKGGLRSAEIVGLDWGDVTDARGHVGQREMNPVTGELEAFFTVPGDIAKKGHYRRVPMHAALLGALQALHASLHPDQRRPQDPIVRPLRPHPNTYYTLRGEVPPPVQRVSPTSLQMYLIRLYTQAGFQGCSSHSGRRTLITAMVRSANNFQCSIKDAQAVAGHKDIESTESYIDASPYVGRMVRGL